MLLPSLIGLILVIVLRVTGGKETFKSIGMAGGRPMLWLLLGLGVVAFFGLQTLLNMLFKMGQAVDLQALFAQIPATGIPQPALFAIIVFQTIVLGPFLGLLVTFGEEYGWRGYLQPALYGLGKVKGVALLGVIWGIWHWPVIWMGYNFPGNPILGSLLMVLYCVGLGFFLGYAVLKAKGLWIAAFLHALANQTLSFFIAMVYKPTEAAWSFGIGIPGIAVLALIVLVILRDPVWKED
jgi:membrane protease YdiL (CAAX protease family)